MEKKRFSNVVSEHAVIEQSSSMVFLTGDRERFSIFYFPSLSLVFLLTSVTITTISLLSLPSLPLPYLPSVFLTSPILCPFSFFSLYFYSNLKQLDLIKIPLPYNLLFSFSFFGTMPVDTQRLHLIAFKEALHSAQRSFQSLRSNLGYPHKKE